LCSKARDEAVEKLFDAGDEGRLPVEGVSGGAYRAEGVYVGGEEVVDGGLDAEAVDERLCL
jgi:2-C-methyl-D-erythritol 4-phosphate cytidylyltransferase